jgi:two-component system, NarL family, sensor kinase
MFFANCHSLGIFDNRQHNCDIAANNKYNYAYLFYNRICMDSQNIDINLLVITFVSLFLLIILLLFILTYTFHKRKTQYLIDQEKQKQVFEQEISNSKIEIQEQTMKNISWELHDNIGQLLSVSKIQLNQLGPQASQNEQKALNDTCEIISNVLTDIRQLSKTLNNDYIKFNGILKSIELDVERFNRLKFVKTSFIVNGNVAHIEPKEEIILFRIIQELLSNVIKHSKAKNLWIVMTYTSDNLNIYLDDDGIGIEEIDFKKGIGITSMTSRAAILASTITFGKSSKGGLNVVVNYPLKSKNNQNLTNNKPSQNEESIYN